MTLSPCAYCGSIGHADKTIVCSNKKEMYPLPVSLSEDQQDTKPSDGPPLMTNEQIRQIQENYLNKKLEVEHSKAEYDKLHLELSETKLRIKTLINKSKVSLRKAEIDEFMIEKSGKFKAEMEDYKSALNKIYTQALPGSLVEKTIIKALAKYR